jgi:hypothetical protein
MKRLGLAFAWLTVIACSDRRRQEVAVDVGEQADLTLPDTHSTGDGSIIVATQAGPPVSPVEQEAAPRDRRARPLRPRSRRKTPVAPPAPTANDDSVQGGAAAGAVLGGVIGGDAKGAVIGGVAGAAAGAVVASQTATRDVVVKAKTPVVLVLTAPLLTP